MSKALHLEMPPMPGLDDRVRDVLNEKLLRIADALKQSVDPGLPLQGSHVDRIVRYPSDQVAEGKLFYETDTEVTFINRKVGNILVWCYQAGVHATTLAKRPTGLSRYDNGYLLRVTTGTGGVEYNHLVRWNGLTNKWEPADRLGGFFGKYAKTPTEAGWHLADGSATTYLDISAAGDLIETAFTTPDLTTGAYMKGGAYTGTVNAAGTATLSGNTGDTSGGTPAGTVSQPTLTMNSYTPAGTNSAPSLTMNSYTPSGTVSQPTFTGNAIITTSATVGGTTAVGFSQIGGVGPGNPHTPSGTVSQPTFTGNAATLTGTVAAPTFTGTPATLTGTVSQPTFTGSALAAHHHSLSSGTITLPTDPVKNIAVRVYFRR